MRLHSRTKH